jgi:hypothetical protein
MWPMSENAPKKYILIPHVEINKLLYFIHQIHEFKVESLKNIFSEPFQTCGTLYRVGE